MVAVGEHGTNRVSAARRSASELAEVHKAQALIDVAQSLRSLVDEVRRISQTVARMEMRRAR